MFKNVELIFLEIVQFLQFGNSIGHSNMASITQYYSSESKRGRCEMQDCDDDHVFRRRTCNKINDGH